MVAFIKSHKKFLIIFLSVILSMAVAIACAFLITKSVKQISNEMSDYSYMSAASAISVVNDVAETLENTNSSIDSEPAPPPPTVINAYSPYEKQTLAAGSSFTAIISARPDSTAVTASFNGQTINLEMQPYAANADGSAPEFVNFAGTFTLPTGNDSDLNLGKVTFFAKWNGYSQKYSSPNIICLRDTALDRIMVVEVVADTAETFSGNTTNDHSDPRYSYLPKGTVDYKVGSVIYDSSSGNSYYKLRCGRRVYIDKKNPPDTQRSAVTVAYEGSVPDTNEVSFVSTEISGNHTYFTFNTAWKAPFALDIAPQSYNNPSTRDFTIQNATYSYVDIKFYYTAAIGGEVNIPADNPLFSSAQIVQADGGCILRLNLKRTGGFYGWDCYYNESGQLTFKFLNPKTIQLSDNEYAANLSGVTILIDVGHGGRDKGASGLWGDTMPEAERNLNLAYKLKSELEKIGASVVMTRYDDTAVTADGRCAALRKTAPDLCVSIHHDSAERQSANGCGIFCFNAFSDAATKYVYSHIANSGIYANTYKTWHYFYLAKTPTCPVVLIENGFISSPQDFAGISDDYTNTLKAKTIVAGVADYFKSIQ